MLKILESPKHLVAAQISGDLTADDVTRAYKAIEDALKENDRVSFFAEIDPSMTLTFQGMLKDLTEGLGQVCKLNRYYRAAVVTDKGWIGTITRLEGLIFSSIDMRVFGHDDRAKAFAWASEVPTPAPDEPEPAIRFLQTTNPNVFAYEVVSRLRERDIKEAVREIKPFLEREGKFNVLARMDGFSGFDLLSVFDDDLIRVKIKAPSKIDKYAIVGPRPWMRNLVELFGSLFTTKIRTFDSSEEAEAWEWVGAQQALLTE